MSGRGLRPARYRPGKAPAPELSASSDEDAPENVHGPENAEPLTLPSHTAVPGAFSAGVTIQQGAGAIRFPPEGARSGADVPAPKAYTTASVPAAPDVDLSEYETDTEEEETPTANVPSPPAPAPVRAPMRPITAQPKPPPRAPAAVTLQAQTLAPPPAQSETETETETESTSASESEPEPVMLKPVFVPKYVTSSHRRDRGPARELRPHSTQQHTDDMRARKQAAHDLAAERVQRELREQEHKEATHDVDDTDGLDPDAEFAAWRLRELARIQRVQTQERLRREEEEEIARRRALPEHLRLKEDLEHARRTRQAKQKGSQGFLQKYHHKGAFYQDMDILQRDYTQQTESAVDKAALPKIMQVRDFGKRSRSKWTHLANEDTTRHERDLRSQGL